MKEKIIEKRLIENVKNIRQVLNEVVLIAPIQKGESLKEVADNLAINFIRSSTVLEFPAKSSGDGKFTSIYVKEGQSVKSILESYLDEFHKYCPTGQGFTPRLAISEHEEISGYNCFGKAMAFASYTMFHKIKTGLAFSVDHTMCVCYDGEDKYLCDPTNGTIKKMHGKFIEHEMYDWYVKSKDETDFIFNHLILTSVGVGGLYNICKSFDFLKRTPWDHSRNKILPDYDYTADLFKIMDPKLPYRKIICSLDWDNIIHKAFSSLNEYKKTYSKEWTLEIEMIRLHRERMLLHNKFDRVLVSAMRATNFGGNVKEFYTHYLPVMVPFSEEIFMYLNFGLKITSKIPKNLEVWLKVLRDFFDKDISLKEYSIKKIQGKISKQLIEPQILNSFF